MIDRSRLTRLALAAALLCLPLLACPGPEPEPVPPVVVTTGEEPTLAADLAAQSTLQAAITRINHSTCVSRGNRDQTTVIDWQPDDPTAPEEVLWLSQGKPQGFSFVITPKADQPQAILDMFDPRYDSGPHSNLKASGKPRNPPFNGADYVLWKYTIEVFNAHGERVCVKDPDVCVRVRGGCGI